MSETVLIADSHAQRGRDVALACRGLGLTVHVVTHGAAALEYALSQKPLAMVTQQQLPLIDGTRLAEILQANPHTQDVGVLFVDEEAEEGPASLDAPQPMLPGRADPDSIARFIAALLERRVPARPDDEPAGGPAIEGRLAQIAPAELIELFHVNRKTGVIELRRGAGRAAAAGEIALQFGDVVAARAGEVEGEKAFFRMLRWRRGSFAFREEPFRDARSIERPTRALLREAARQADEWAALGAELPPEHARVALKVARASLPNVLHPLTQEVLLVLELSDRVQEVLDRCSHPDYQVLRTLQTLARRGMIALEVDADDDPRPAAGLFSPAVAARLRDWLDAGRPGGCLADAKVPVIAGESGSVRTLASLVAQLPGVETPREAATPKGPPAPGIAPLLRLPVDAELGIGLLEVPAAPRHAPIWPLAAHGALATLFLHTGAIDASVEALRPAVDAVERLPRARAFHLVLEDKDRGARELLCERLGLFDDRFVASVPLEQPDAALAALRELLTRLLP